MMNAYTVLTVFLSIFVFLASLVTGQPQRYPCAGCSCAKEHQRFNGTISEFVIAFCQFKTGDKMTSIPQNLPRRLHTLRMTSHNVRVLETTSLRNYPYLHKLYLDKNGLQTIQSGAFSQQQFLIELDLKENELTNISSQTFQGLVSLTTLRLDHNKLQNISRGTFASIPFIDYLDLRVNSITVLEEGAFDRLDYLRTLLLSSNKLTAINSGVLGNLMSLTRLEFASNQVRKIDKDTFRCAPLVKKLTLKGNQLDKIPKKSIRDLQFLEILDISENPVSFIESDALIGLESLTTMYVNNCSISGIQENAFDDLKEITTIHLKHNPLNCDCHLSWLPRWLSRKPKVTFDGGACEAPHDISGQEVTSVNLQSFVCTCAECKKDATCNLLLTNCSCPKNWTGLSCNDTCQSYNQSVSTCRKFGGKCFCERNTAKLKKQRFSNCSFNITSEKCSEHGEIRKDGAHLECVCKNGFIGNGVNCTDVDECKEGGALCPLHADCINTLGSHRCECRVGFKNILPPVPGQEVILCEDIDECQESKPCALHALCHNNKGSYTCTCLYGYTGDGKTCLPVPDKPEMLKVTELSPSEVRVTWSVTNTSIITHITVEYKGFGIHGSEWEVVILQPQETKTHLTDLETDSTYLVRVGAFSIFNTSTYSDEKIFKTPAKNQVPSDRVTGDSQNSVVIAVSIVVSIAVLAFIAFGLYLLMRRRKKHKKKTSHPQFAPGLEDLIEMRTRSHSGEESRANRELLELGSNLHSFTSYAVDYNHEWEIPRDQLVIGQKIGEGQFGLVLEGTLMTEDGPLRVAVKTIKEHADRYDIKDLLQEMEMMKEIGQHPHVVSLIGTCTTPGPLYIVTEFVSGGNLLDYLRASRPADETYVNVTSTLSSRDLLKIALDCARGMNHIANKKFVHRDLAARNILLTEDYEAKVADFGLARDVYGDGQYVKTGGGRLPIKWMAPESIQDQIYTTMSDVWSFGILLWEIVTIGGAPYPCVPVNLLLTKLLCGYRMSKPAHCSDELYDLMMSCWQLDPEARPTFSEMCHILSEMLSESARSYVNITVSEETVGPEDEDSDDTHEQTTSV